MTIAAMPRHGKKRAISIASNNIFSSLEEPYVFLVAAE
jgi:hypothetical protein